MIHWIDDQHLDLDGVRFRLDMSGERPLDDGGSEIVLMKTCELVKAYADALAPYHNCNVVEVGVWGGGSTILWHRLLRPRKLVAIELEHEVPKALSRYIDENALEGTIVPCFGVDQSDTEALREILRREFADEQVVDVVIDDASHRYEPTKAAFNELFRWLRTGGRYFIEDWGWAHWPGRFQDFWKDEPALSNLLFELTMVLACWGGYIVSRVDVRRGFAAIERGEGRLHDPFDVSTLFLSRGRKFERI